MADKKKVYSISINGLKESVDMVDSLNAQLKELDKSIAKIEGRTIKIKGALDIETPKEKTVVSGKNTTDTGDATKEERVEAEKLLAVKKQISAEEKTEAKLAAMTTDEYKKSYTAQYQAKEEIKQMKKELEAAAAEQSLLNDSGKQYANTMAGMKQELKNLKTVRDSLDLAKPEDVERFKEIQQRCLELETLLKSIESEAGVFSRNVGNYPQLVKQATTEWENIQKVIASLSDKLSKATPGTEAYDKLKSELEQAEKYAQRLDERLGELKSNLNEVNRTGVKLDIAGKEREFNSVKDAVKSLTRELQEMALAGKEDTVEFKATMETLGRLKTTIAQTSDEVKSYVGNSKGLSDTIEVMKGVAGIMSIGTGLAALFGGTNKELDETLRKFAGLTMVLQGLETEYQALQNKQSIFGEYLSKTWKWLDKIGKYTGLDWIIGKLDKASKATDRWYQKIKASVDWQKKMKNEQQVSEQYSQSMTTVMKFVPDDASLKKLQQEVITSLSNLETFKMTFQFDNKEDALNRIKEMKNDLIENLDQLEDMKINLEVNDASEDEIQHIDDLIASTQQRLANLDNTELYINTGNTEDVFADIDNTIGKLTDKIDELDAAGKDSSGLKEMRNSLEKFKEQAVSATTASTGLSAKLIAAGAAGKVVAGGLNLATMAVKGLTMAIKALGKATIILAVLQAAMEVLQPIIEAVSSAVNSLISLVGSLFSGKGFGRLDIDKQMEMLAGNAELANKQLERYINNVNVARNLGLISELQAQGLAFRAIDEQIKKAGKDLQEYIKIQDELEYKSLQNNFNNSHIWGDDADIENLEEFKKEWDILVKAVETGQDKIAAGSTRGWGWLLTAGDAVEELGDKTKAVLGDMQIKINQIDFNNPEQAVKDFRKIADNELYQSALTQMHTLFPEEEWAKTLDRMYKTLSDFVDKSEKRADDLAVAMKKANDEMKDAAELSNINAIPDANKRQAALDEYNKKKRQKEINESIADEEYKQKALEALDKEYETKRKERIKSHLKTMQAAGDAEYAILKQIRDNLLELEKEGLDKQLKQLENAMADELHAAEKSTKHRGELIESIRKKYAKKIEDFEKEWYKKQKKQREKWDKELLKMARETADELADIQNTANLNTINRGLEENENQNVKRTTTISYETNVDTSKMSFADNDKLVEDQKKYYQEMLKAQSEYIAEKTKLQLEESLENERQLKEQAEREYNQRLASNKEWYDTQIEQQDEAKKQGEVTEEEYQKNILSIKNTYQQSDADATETYQTKLSEIAKNGEQERNNIVSDGRQEQQRINDEANQKAISAIQDYYNEIADIAEREQKQNMNRHTGLFNYAKEKERLEKVKEAYDKTIADLEAEYEKLKQQLNDNEIDFSQFQAGKKQIEDLKKQAKKSAEETSESLSDLFQNWAQSVDDFANKVASQFQEMFSTFQNIQSLMLDSEQNQLDEEEKMLDKQKDAVEKAYEKQAEIVQRYKDAINGTEDELKNARGERRLALLDSLAQQKEGYAAETEALKKQELEKEKIAKKEEQLKKKQDALEKKRKKQQQVASVINATINTALGVTQALASWPPPASYALAAAVGALGAVEIALIASQKYAKGGLIEGPDHAHGGVKVQTKKGIAEVEGNEYIVNKKTTTENLSLIEFVNSKKRRLSLDDFVEFYSGRAKSVKRPGSSLKFADGGAMPELTDYSQMVENQPVQVELTLDSKVSVVDIQNALDRLTQTKVLAGL